MLKKMRTIGLGLFSMVVFAFASKQIENGRVTEYVNSEAYTIYNYNTNANLQTQLVATYAAATQGALWGMVGGPGVGFLVGLGVGV